MPRVKTDEKIRVHIWLGADDVADIRALYGSTIGFSKAIQLMVAKSLRHIKEKAAAQGKTLALRGDELESAE